MNRCPGCDQPVAAAVPRCPSCGIDLTIDPRATQPPQRPPARRGTMIEPLEKVRRAAAEAAKPPVAPDPPAGVPSPRATLREPLPRSGMFGVGAPVAPTSADDPYQTRPPGIQPAPPTSPTPTPGASPTGQDTHREPAPPESPARPYRPHARPPMALLVALDDGSDTRGENIRVRHSPFVIGRQQGDVVIPHDTEISGKHCQIVRREENGAHRWHLVDLQSTNGTFLRAARIPLANGLQVLIGRLRYEYRCGTTTASVRTPTESQQQRARDADVADATQLERARPSFVELTPDGYGRIYWIPLGVDSIVGSGAACGVQILGDPCVDRAHARITTDEHGRTFLENLDSLNGTFVRIHEQPIDQNCEFQIGEQRFLLRFP